MRSSHLLPKGGVSKLGTGLTINYAFFLITLIFDIKLLKECWKYLNEPHQNIHKRDIITCCSKIDYTQKKLTFYPHKFF